MGLAIEFITALTCIRTTLSRIKSFVPEGHQWIHFRRSTCLQIAGQESDQNQPQDIGSSRPQGHPNADLVSALSYGIRHHAIDSGDGQNQCGYRKHAKDHETEAAAIERR